MDDLMFPLLPNDLANHHQEKFSTKPDISLHAAMIHQLIFYLPDSTESNHKLEQTQKEPSSKRAFHSSLTQFIVKLVQNCHFLNLGQSTVTTLCNVMSIDKKLQRENSILLR